MPTGIAQVSPYMPRDPAQRDRVTGKRYSVREGERAGRARVDDLPDRGSV